MEPVLSPVSGAGRADKIIRIRFDTKVRLLEVGGEITGDTTKIFHAMPARPKYTRRIKL